VLKSTRRVLRLEVESDGDKHRGSSHNNIKPTLPSQHDIAFLLVGKMLLSMTDMKYFQTALEVLCYRTHPRQAAARLTPGNGQRITGQPSPRTGSLMIQLLKIAVLLALVLGACATGNPGLLGREGAAGKA
jgi:hypothetical protein